MNKRIYKKVYKSNNKKIIMNLLDNFLEMSTFTLNKNMGLSFNKSNYFLEDNNRDVEFYVNELPNWRLCISLNFYGDNIVRFFGENDYLIDKFRPSSTYINETDLENFIIKIKDIKSDLKYHFVNSLTFNRLDFDYVEESDDFGGITVKGYQAVYDKESCSFYRDESIVLSEYIDSKYNDFFESKNLIYINEINERESFLTVLKLHLEDNSDVLNAGLFDNNIGRWACYPRYDVSLLVTNEVYNNKEKLNYLFDLLKEIMSNFNNFQIGYIYNIKNDFNKLTTYKIK